MTFLLLDDVTYCNLPCRKAPSLPTFEIAQYDLNADWLAPLIITLFARADHVRVKYSGQMRRTIE